MRRLAAALSFNVALGWALHAAPHHSGPMPPPDPLPDSLRDVAQQAATDCSQGDYDGAAACYQKIAEAAPTCPYGWANLGIVRFNQKRYPDALSPLTKALALAPDDYQSMVNRGSTYTRLELFPSAVQDFQHAIKLKPDDAFAHQGLSEVYDKMGDHRQAEAEAKTAKTLESAPHPDALPEDGALPSEDTPTGNTLQARFLRANQKMVQGAHEATTDPKDSRAKLSSAFKELQSIHASNPEWETTLVTSRIADLQKMLRNSAQ